MHAIKEKVTSLWSYGAIGMRMFYTVTLTYIFKVKNFKETYPKIYDWHITKPDNVWWIIKICCGRSRDLSPDPIPRRVRCHCSLALLAVPELNTPSTNHIRNPSRKMKSSFNTNCKLKINDFTVYFNRMCTTSLLEFYNFLRCDTHARYCIWAIFKHKLFILIGVTF